MQKRLSASDWALYGVLILLVILVVLLIYQVDRQWSKLDDMQTALSEQARDVRGLRTALTSGQFAQQATNSSQQNSTEQAAVAPAFQRAFAATQQEDYAQGDWSVGYFGTNLGTITPLVSSDAYASAVQENVLETLITRDPDTLEWQGLLARDWQVSDDGLVITFQLREDVSFSDGEPLTAADVVFTYDFIMNEAIQAPRHRAYLEKIKSVEAQGEYEVVFIFAEPYFEALSLAGTINVLPQHFYAPYLKQPETFNQSKGLLLGSGPYRLEDPKAWTPDQGSIELVRNKRYWGDVQPSYERLLWKVIQNDSARLTTYRNGDIDVYQARPIEYEKLKSDEQIMGKSHNFEYMPPVAGYSYIGWNQRRGDEPTRFADKRVRQAMSYLTDVERVIEDVFLGYAERAVSPFSNTSKQHDPALKPYPYDMEKALSLLKAAGYEDRDQDGVLENEAGEPFEFELTYSESSEDTKRMVLLLKDIYARAGVKMKPSPQEWPVMLEMMNKKDYDAIVLGWTSGIETDIYQMFHSSQSGAKGDNFISYTNKKLDQLIEQARATVDTDKRMPLWQQAEAILHEDQPYTFLFRRNALVFIDQRVQNLQMTNLGLNRLNKPLETYVPRAMQQYTD